MTRRQPVHRSWWAVRWRQLRNPPPPVLRAVLANLLLAAAGGTLLLAYSLVDPAADLVLGVGLFIVGVLISGSVLTYLWVELPAGSSGVRRRSAWSALLGFFAGLPICYLVLVVLLQVLEPALRGGG